MAPDTSSLPDKPAIGEPCNGCGLCCRLEVCSVGSFALGLVPEYGQRAPGPCPALTQDGEGWTCGVMKRPTDWLPGHSRGPTVIRQAWAVLIGAGIGCDEAGDEPDEIAQPKLDLVRDRFLGRHSREEINRAIRTVLDLDR